MLKKKVKPISLSKQEEHIRGKLKEMDRMIANITASHKLFTIITEQRKKLHEQLLEILKKKI